MTGDEWPEVVEQAEAAYEAIRRINHITGGPIPAPLLYQVLGNLKLLGHSLPQALLQLGDGLVASLGRSDVYEDDGRDPTVSVATAQDHLERAAELAAQVGEHLERAQSAISRQGYRTAGDE
ncbi:MAG TPA: hypothetical protein VGJ95_24040 [Pseudonocardiaceae bacterium]|jgi:hypothetical protein